MKTHISIGIYNENVNFGPWIFSHFPSVFSDYFFKSDFFQFLFVFVFKLQIFFRLLFQARFFQIFFQIAFSSQIFFRFFSDYFFKSDFFSDCFFKSDFFSHSKSDFFQKLIISRIWAYGW